MVNKAGCRGHLKSFHVMKLITVQEAKIIHPDAKLIRFHQHIIVLVCEKHFGDTGKYRRHIRRVHKIDIPPLAVT